MKKLNLLLGLIFGAALGVLFAPRSGRQLRAKIKSDRRKGRLGIAPLRDDLKNIVTDIALVAKQVSRSDVVSNIVEAGRERLEDVKERLSEKFAAIPAEPVDGFEIHPIEPGKRGKRKKGN